MRRRDERLTEGKKSIIADLIREYDIQDALEDILGGTIESMLAAEMDNHLGYSPYERTDVENACDGKKQKAVRSRSGEMDIDVPQERNNSFEPKIEKKRFSIKDKIIAIYVKGLATRQISEQVEDIYSFEVSKDMVSNIS